jgi:hypothetical protein
METQATQSNTGVSNKVLGGRYRRKKEGREAPRRHILTSHKVNRMTVLWSACAAGTRSGGALR